MLLGGLSRLIERLKGSHTVEAVPTKRQGAATRSQRPVRARIREMVEAVPPDDKATGQAKGREREQELVPAKEGPALKPVAPKPVAPAPREPRRKRYQKWRF